MPQVNWSTDGQLGSISPCRGRGKAPQDELPGSRGVVGLPWKWGMLSSNCKAKLV